MGKKILLVIKKRINVVHYRYVLINAFCIAQAKQKKMKIAPNYADR